MGPTSKAIAGAVVTIIVFLLAKYGVVLPVEVNDAVQLLVGLIITGLIGFVGVYFAPRNTER